MTDDARVEDGETELDLQLEFGGIFRFFEVGFFAVVLVVSLVALASGGAELILGNASGLFRSLLSVLGGAFGGLVSVAGGLNAWRLLRDRRPALEISEEGILNRTYWSATTLVPWEEVIDIQKTRYSWILDVVLRDPEAFRRRQILPIRIMMNITSRFGIGTLPVYLPQFDASREEASRLLSAAFEARELAVIREHRRLENAERPELPSPESG